jgi:hypothetical protein
MHEASVLVLVAEQTEKEGKRWRSEGGGDEKVEKLSTTVSTVSRKMSTNSNDHLPSGDGNCFLSNDGEHLQRFAPLPTSGTLLPSADNLL